jgi:hypothetical protein
LDEEAAMTPTAQVLSRPNTSTMIPQQPVVEFLRRMVAELEANPDQAAVANVLHEHRCTLSAILTVAEPGFQSRLADVQSQMAAEMDLEPILSYDEFVEKYPISTDA